MRTIQDISHLLKPIDDIILAKLIPAITDGIKINQTEKKLPSLPAKYGGLAIPVFAKISDDEYQIAKRIKNKNKNRRIKKRVERKSTSLDEAEPRTKCVELANISTTQRKRLYRKQAMHLRLGKNSLWLAIRSPTFKMRM